MFLIQVLLLLAIPLAGLASTPNFAQLKLLAEWSAFSYGTEDDIKAFASQNQQKIIIQKHISDLQINYIFLEDIYKKSQLLVISGASNLDRIMTHIDFPLMTDTKSGLQLHKGFTEAAAVIYQQVLPRLNQQYNITTTGHSLGGAIAQIIAIYM